MSQNDTKQREDGRATREKLLDCAEQLTAKKGFASVTSKEICQMAGTNLAAVNYHFGSREGLYEEMLYRLHNRIVSETALQEIAQSDRTPDDPVLYSGLISTMAPILLLNLKEFFPIRKEETPHRIFSDPAFHQAVHAFAFAGLDALKKNCRALKIAEL